MERLEHEVILVSTPVTLHILAKTLAQLTYSASRKYGMCAEGTLRRPIEWIFIT